MNPQNRPKKGDSIKVEPIRNQKDVDAIKKMLGENPRDHLLFVMGINNGLRAGDLLKLKAGDVSGLKAGEYITIREGKTGKENVLMINKAVHKALRRYLESANPADDEYLFRSRKGGNKPLTIQSVNALVKRWTGAVNIKGNFGAHSLRKTWGYHERMYHNAGFEVICDRFKHSSPAVTMRYLGIESKEVLKLLAHEI